MYAPAPRCNTTSSSNAEPSTDAPNTPFAYASRIAASRISPGHRNSPRQYTKARWLWTAYAAIAIPSRNRCGSRSMISRLLNVPGSDSSKFATTYVGLPVSCGTNDHLTPVGNPAPPRPRRPDVLTTSITSAGVIAMAARSPSYPPAAR
jgi:hypothetical protein